MARLMDFRTCRSWMIALVTAFSTHIHAGALQTNLPTNTLNRSMNAVGMQSTEVYRGHVNVVDSGDVISIQLPDNQSVRVQLADIDAPDPDQPWGFQAKQQLSKTIFDKDVAVQSVQRDSYGNVVGRVWLGDLNINVSMVLSGNAWLNPGVDDLELVHAEQQAKTHRAGLWGQEQSLVVAPWDWRAQHQGDTKAKAKASSEKPAQSFSCGNKHTCMEMTSCEEARHYLNNCGVRALDWDGDGIPCRSLCRK